jgi:hypothetical protein
LLFPCLVERGNFFVHELSKTVAKGFVVGIEKGAFNHGVIYKTVEGAEAPN